MTAPDATSYNARKRQAQNLLQQGKLDQALSVYERLHAERKTDAEVLYMLGSIHGQKGEYEKAASHLQDAASLQPDAIQVYWGLGAACKELGDFSSAENAFRTVLQQHPQDPDVLLELAMTLVNQKRLGEAKEYLKQALQLKPGSAEILEGLGQASHAASDISMAIGYYKRALEIDPSRPVTHNLLGHALHLISDYQAAIRHFEMAVQIDPHFYLAYKNMGYAFMSLGNTTEARTAFRKALQIEPEYASATIGESVLYEREGDYQQAYETILPLIDRGILNAELACSFVNICRQNDSCDEAISYAGKVLAETTPSRGLGEQLHMAMGKLYDRMGEYDKAFDHYRAGNELRTATFNTTEYVSTIEALTEVFSPRFMATAPRASIRSDRPVFILGMPRSGTTLAEQILSRHPDVHGAGELDYINRIPPTIAAYTGEVPGYPFNVNRLTSENLDSIAKGYLDYLDTLNRTAARVTDKAPHNFLSMGLIAMLFPNARIIHCKRDPRDNCLSIYFQNFSELHTYSSKLTDIGLYYRHYRKLTDHYKRVLGIPILDFHYEDLIADQETMTRKLLDFIGLPWDDRCLEFHKSGRFVSTPSFDQVSQPLYSSSAGRWKKYEKHLGPLLDALGMK